MEVRIIKNNKPQSWYRDRIGEVFNVIDVDEENKQYIVHKGRILNSYINFEDCEIISNGTNKQQDNNNKKQINISFSSESELRAYIKLHMPIAVRPVRKAKTNFIYPFSSFNARNQIVESMVECLINKK